MTVTEHKPMVKQVKPICFLFYRTETTLARLGDFFHVANELHAEATALKLRVTGPIHWHYFGFTGDASKPFTLEIALPVENIVPGYDGTFHFKRTEDYRCISIVHEGNWLEMPESYARVMEFAAQHKLVPAGASREIYSNVDFAYPEANVTEIQLGIY